MTKLDDETLVAYADGELDPRRVSEVEAALQIDAEARERVRIFKETAAMVGNAFDGPLHQPVPDRLLAVLQRSDEEGGGIFSSVRRRRLPRPARPFVFDSVRKFPRPALSLVASVALLIGLSGGLLLSNFIQTVADRKGGGPLAVQDTAITAIHTELSRVLERSLGAIAIAMEEAGYEAWDVARALRDQYDATAETAAEKLKQAGYEAWDVASALKDEYDATTETAALWLKGAGYSATDVALALGDEFGATAETAALWLKEAGYSATDVALALGDEFGATAETAALWLKEAGYPAADVALALADRFNVTVDQIALHLKTGGYTINQVANTLKTVFHKSAADTALILSRIGYGFFEIQAGLMSVFNLTLPQVTNILYSLGIQ
ncbi:MAG: anti-sigma factor family protein [Alphaproteobacteria bacterium]